MTWHVFKVHPWCDMYQYFIPLQWLNNIPLNWYISYFVLYICLETDIRVFARELLQITLLWTFRHKCFLWTYVLIFFCKYLWVELLDHMLILCFTIWGTTRLFSKSDYRFTFSSAVCEGCDLSISSPTCIICVYDSHHSSGWKWCSFDLHFTDD